MIESERERILFFLSYNRKTRGSGVILEGKPGDSTQYFLIHWGHEWVEIVSTPSLWMTVCPNCRATIATGPSPLGTVPCYESISMECKFMCPPERLWLISSLYFTDPLLVYFNIRANWNTLPFTRALYTNYGVVWRVVNVDGPWNHSHNIIKIYYLFFHFNMLNKISLFMCRMLLLILYNHYRKYGEDDIVKIVKASHIKITGPCV